jgi:polysaccharide export outer membrane protein
MIKTAAGDKSKILRKVNGSASRTEIAINIKQLMAGKAPDVPLQPDDILFIPNSDAKSAGFRTLDAIVNAASGLALYASRF